MHRNRAVEHRSRRRILFAWAAIACVAAVLSGVASSGPSPQRMTAAAAPTWAAWVEADFPFFSSVVDARKAGAGLPADNLTPRGLVLNLGDGLWAAFDTDLVRVAALWRGKGVTPVALAPGSYHTPDHKTQPGQSALPEPDGRVWIANGIYPGWQPGTSPSLTDPREPAPSAAEVGRGPLPGPVARFNAVRLTREGVVLEYTAGGADVREWLSGAIDRGGSGSALIVRHFHVAPSATPLWVALGTAAAALTVALCGRDAASTTLESVPSPDGDRKVSFVRVPPRDRAVEFCAAFSDGPPDLSGIGNSSIPSRAPGVRWPQHVSTRITPSTAQDAYVVDDVALPVENLWRRNVRPGDIQFLKDGTGAVVTVDGDVWLVRGLGDAAGVARWTRFASGLHEPMTLAIRDEQIYVFDRNGIWRLRDTNGDGEADRHELFSNAFAQTADTREFPSTIRLAPRGEFVIAKGGQESATIGKHNGSVLRISADGRNATVLGYGFRQPNISVHPHTGLVLASDQQGEYIPTTPLHIVRDRQFYGFLSNKLPREVYPAPIAEPLTWMPHAANASATSQIWLFGARMGPLTNGLVHIGFNNPELFRVMFNERGARPQAALVSVTRAFDYPTLNGSVNPADGQLYLTGFQIFGWGTTATRLTGLGRVRYTGAVSTLPREVAAMDTGVLLRFDVALDPEKAGNADNYSLTSWHYKRTYQYGSPQFKADGTPGIDRHPPSHAYLSEDGRSVFIAVPGMTRVMQMRLGWSLATKDGLPFEQSAYFTPYELTAFDPVAEGFGALTVDLSPRAAAEEQSPPVSVAEGRRLYQLYGCIACHSIENTSFSRLGPTWKGLYGAPRTYAKGVLTTTADDAYLRESILAPAARVVTGYERGDAGMPSYAGVLTEPQIESILLFIKSLK
jgi:glucose/arabinose dehydrogenase/mono/diheme cytochrome c family protein